MDHDDIALKNRFEEQLKVLEADPDMVLTGSWAQNIDGSGQVLPPRVQYRDTPEQSRIRLLFRNQFISSTLMFRRVEGMDIRYRPEFPMSEDYDFLVRLSEAGKVCVISKPLLKYRVHDANYSELRHLDVERFSQQVKRQQVAGLGIQASAEDLAVHAVFEHRRAYYKPGLLPRLGAWTRHLIAGNERSRLYPRRDFAHVTYSELAMAAEFASRKGKEALPSYVESTYLRAFMRHPGAAVRMLLKLSLGLR